MACAKRNAIKNLLTTLNPPSGNILRYSTAKLAFAATTPQLNVIELAI